MNDPVYSHVPRSLVDQVYCVYFSVTSNAMTTCPAAPIFSLELRLGPAGLWEYLGPSTAYALWRGSGVLAMVAIRKSNIINVMYCVMTHVNHC